MDVAIVAKKGGEYIEATIADDEWMQHRQDLVTYQGRGPLRAGRGSGSGIPSSGRGRGRGQRSEALITFPPRKVCTSSCDCASECWIQEPGKAPHPVRIPTSEEDFLAGGPLTVGSDSRRKRVRDSSSSSDTSLEICGAEESKGDYSFPPPSRNSITDLPAPQFASPEPLPVFPALEALRQYIILVDGARMDGPDYTPCEWTADLLLQDIPWSHLPLICALRRPLDFIPTSHVLKVRRAFTHCLQAVLASPLDDLLWKRFCLLPTVLFIDIGKHRRADLDCKINLILADTWPFKVGDFPGRMTKPKPVKFSSTPNRGPRPAAVPVVIGSDFDPDKRRLDYFKKLMSKGEVSKAYRVIVSDAKVPGGPNFPSVEASVSEAQFTSVDTCHAGPDG